MTQNIAAGTENDGFTFTGLPEEHKKTVNVIWFRTSDVAFVPREALETFPNLREIAIVDREFETLTFDFLSNLLKFVKPKIKKLSFFMCYLERIDPRVIPIFQEMEEVNLNYNICVKKSFETKEDFAEMDSILKQCTDNFEAFEEEKALEAAKTDVNSVDALDKGSKNILKNVILLIFLSIFA